MSNRRRYLISAAVLAACVCVALALVVALSPLPPATAEDYGKIQFGMSKAEVVSILKSGPTSGPGEMWMTLGGTMASMTMQREGHVWKSTECTIWVTFDDDSKVTGKMLSSFGRQPESLSDKLRRWLHFPE